MFNCGRNCPSVGACGVTFGTLLEAGTDGKTEAKDRVERNRGARDTLARRLRA